MSIQGADLTRIPLAIPGLLGEVRKGAEAVRLLVVSGPPSTAADLRKALTKGGDQSLVCIVSLLELDRPELASATAIIYAIKEGATPADEHALRRADRQGVPLLCLVLAREKPDRILPYVAATDVIWAQSVDPEVLHALAVRLSERAPEAAWALARRLPVLQAAVSRRVVSSTARRNALLAATGRLLPGPDLPALTLSQLRMTLRLAAVHGRKPESAVPLSLLGAVGAGLACRALARVASERLPLPAPLVRGAVTYAATRALGTAAIARLES